MIPTDRVRRDKFIKGLDSMVARDVRVTMSKTGITYAQAVERALAAERTVQLSAREHAVSRENKGIAQAAAGAQRIGSSGDQKRKASELIVSVWNSESTRSSGQRHEIRSLEGLSVM